MRIDPSHIHPPLIRQLFGKAEKEQGGEEGGGRRNGDESCRRGRFATLHRQPSNYFSS